MSGVRFWPKAEIGRTKRGRSPSPRCWSTVSTRVDGQPIPARGTVSTSARRRGRSSGPGKLGRVLTSGTSLKVI